MPKDMYAAQKKYLRAKYVRFPLDLKPELLSEFKARCEAAGTTPTAEIKHFIAQYCKDEAKAEAED